MNLKTKTLSLLAAFSLVLGGALAGYQTASVITQPQPAPTTTVLPDGPQTLGVVIRLYDSGPAFHLDADHWESGIDVARGVDIDASGFLVIYTKEKNAVINCEANPDETLVARGITAGCSNGSHLVRFRLVKVGLDGQPAPLDLNNPIHWSRVSGAYSNLWVDITHDGRWTS